MFIAMNRFRIAHGMEEGFETIWRERDSYLSEVPGFQSFALLKGAVTDEHVVYASHTIWKTKEQFEAWTESDHFRKAHAQKKAPSGTYLGNPELELFESVVE